MSDEIKEVRSDRDRAGLGIDDCCLDCGAFICSHIVAECLSGVVTTDRLMVEEQTRDGLLNDLTVMRRQADEHTRLEGPALATIKELQAERDSLAASLEAMTAKRDEVADEMIRARNECHDLRSELSELRARVEAAVVELREFVAEGGYEFVAKTAPEAFLQQELKDIISRVRAILAPQTR